MSDTQAFNYDTTPLTGTQVFFCRLFGAALVVSAVIFVALLIFAPGMSLESREQIIGVLLVVTFPSFIGWALLRLAPKGRRIIFLGVLAICLVCAVLMFQGFIALFT